MRCGRGPRPPACNGFQVPSFASAVGASCQLCSRHTNMRWSDYKATSIQCCSHPATDADMVGTPPRSALMRATPRPPIEPVVSCLLGSQRAPAPQQTATHREKQQQSCLQSSQLRNRETTVRKAVLQGHLRRLQKWGGQTHSQCGCPTALPATAAARKGAQCGAAPPAGPKAGLGTPPLCHLRGGNPQAQPPGS